MARKTYSEQDREQIRIALMSTTLRCIADRGLIHSSIDILCKEVGISKTSSTPFSLPKRSWCWKHFGISSPDCWDTLAI